MSFNRWAATLWSKSWYVGRPSELWPRGSTDWCGRLLFRSVIRESHRGVLSYTSIPTCSAANQASIGAVVFVVAARVDRGVRRLMPGYPLKGGTASRSRGPCMIRRVLPERIQASSAPIERSAVIIPACPLDEGCVLLELDGGFGLAVLVAAVCNNQSRWAQFS